MCVTVSLRKDGLPDGGGALRAVAVGRERHGRRQAGHLHRLRPRGGGDAVGFPGALHGAGPGRQCHGDHDDRQAPRDAHPDEPPPG